MKQKIFQFAVLYHEKIQVNGQNTPTTEYKTAVVIPIGTMLAADEKTATLKIARDLPEKYMGELQDIEILLRPF